MLIIFGESAQDDLTEFINSIANAMHTFPKKYKHLNIVLRTFQSRIQNWKRAFRKFGKFEERSSKFLEIRKFEKFQMNDAYIFRLRNFTKNQRLQNKT